MQVFFRFIAKRYVLSLKLLNKTKHFGFPSISTGEDPLAPPLFFYKSVPISCIYYRNINLEGNWSLHFLNDPSTFEWLSHFEKWCSLLDLLKLVTKTYKFNTLTKWFLLWGTTRPPQNTINRINDTHDLR